MEKEALVEKITEEVMKLLQGKETIKKLQSTRKALILSYKDETSRQNITQLETLGTECLFLDECHQDEVKYVDFILLPNLSLNSLTYMAMGIEGDEISKRAIRGMLYGKDIFVLSEGIEYRSFQSTSHPHFHQIYMDYEEKLKGYGVKIGSLNEILALTTGQLKQPKESIKQEETEEKAFISNKLITEMALREMCCKENSQLSIDAKAIVTPMAKDYIRMKKIQIVRASTPSQLNS
ncbi:hypothetical protein [Alkaliphilus peptidifermentans]|uniref:Ethanolamine utilization protein n=1 Tax=Alkaliphilus peptidifermentans DSM 18978 TaxID=1120976 RepID=A0A1G5KV30_9FIRM|nr:hypothetical protein [Alkaliphilus peptidifermentans]SCZ04462.1 ethanolamine utilization protein [Alkaliphilus peptidifermentans DSM 18978]